ncbi:MAG: pilus assembly protein PilM [Bdellovibrionales bacterium]|nr:pilus assembly protein PilM [Bdellovibrionales bacterium]
MNWFKKDILGVDFGTRTLKGVKLKQDKAGRVVLAGHFFQDLSLTSESFPNHSNRDEALKAAIEVQRLGASVAAAAVRDSDVTTLGLELPRMSEKELQKAVPLEVSEMSGISPDDHSIDFLVTKGPENNPEVIGVRAYCVKKDLVLNQMKRMKDAGLKPAAIETEMMAIATMLDFNHYLDPREVVMVLDLGEGHVTSALIADGNLAYTRNHETSFGKINQALLESHGVRYSDAEQAKKNYDFLSTPEENPVNRAMDEVFTEIFKTIKDAIDFYRECSESHGRIDRILLVGGGSQIKGIDKVHQIFFRIPTTIVNPFRNIDVFSGLEEAEHEEITKVGPHMATAVGLALQTVRFKGAA